MLGDFSYSNPTKLYFGEHALEGLRKELPAYGKNVLLVYGGGSIRKNGIYDRVVEIDVYKRQGQREGDALRPQNFVDRSRSGLCLAKPDIRCAVIDGLLDCLWGCAGPQCGTGVELHF